MLEIDGKDKNVIICLYKDNNTTRVYINDVCQVEITGKPKSFSIERP